MYHIWLWLRDRQNRLWVTPLLTGLAAVALAFSANAVGLLLGEDVPEISRETIDDLLSVIASSMLALAIFALATLVAALGASSSTATPRSTELLMGDSSARASVGSFIGAFIFAVVARTALGTGYYSTAGRLVLFISTLAVVAFVVLRLLLWIRAGSRLGRLSDTLRRIASVTSRALQEQARRPWLGAAPPQPVQGNAQLINPVQCGYLTDINMPGLQKLAMANDLRIHILVRPGGYVDPGTALAAIQGQASSACMQALRACFVVAADRTFDHDARFGLIVLGEVALRALSPSVNDAGTAIQVMAVMTGLLVEHAGELQASGRQPAVEFDRLSAPACEAGDLVRDAFQPIGRDGAGLFEVAVRMQKLLSVVARNSTGPMAREAALQARIARDRALARLDYAPERERLGALHDSLFR